MVRLRQPEQIKLKLVCYTLGYLVQSGISSLLDDVSLTTIRILTIVFSHKILHSIFFN